MYMNSVFLGFIAARAFVTVSV